MNDQKIYVELKQTFLREKGFEKYIKRLVKVVNIYEVGDNENCTKSVVSDFISDSKCSD
jgi:hypothetical protein